MPIQEKVYWQDTVVKPAGDALAELPPKVDLAVVGGGIPGLSAARQMAKRGASVAVLEAETIGWGASSRNGGMALTGLKLEAEVVEARYGHELTRQLVGDIFSLTGLQFGRLSGGGWFGKPEITESHGKEEIYNQYTPA